jgi:hypothetical protein
MYFHEFIDYGNSRQHEWSNSGYIDGERYDTSKRKKLILSSEIAKTELWNDYFPGVNYKGTHLQCTQKLRKSYLLER